MKVSKRQQNYQSFFLTRKTILKGETEPKKVSGPNISEFPFDMVNEGTVYFFIKTCTKS